MKIDRLCLRHFRNYTQLELLLHPQLTFLIGNNGAGKTNILESLLVLSNLHSFRCVRDQEMIQKGKENARIEAYAGENSYRISLHSRGKSLFMNDVLIRKTSDFFGKINCVLFKPEDLYLFDSSPKDRRELLDIEIGKIHNVYVYFLTSYEKLLREKNALLKKEDIDLHYLDIIEEQMLTPIHEISRFRKEFVAFLSLHAQEYYRLLSGTDKKVSLKYKGNDAYTKEELLYKIRSIREKERIMGFSLFGPQKDDIEAEIENYPLSTYASQGQKRMLMISLKLAIYDYIFVKTKTEPIILLDDILSELDQENRIRLFACLPTGAQTLITATDEEEMKDECYQKYYVVKGEIYDK